MNDLQPVVIVSGPHGEASHLVTTENGPRPAGPPDRCFYCARPIGAEHRKAGDPGVDEESRGCVLRTRLVEMRATVAVIIAVPEDWTEEDVNNRYVEGTWCADNLANMLTGFADDETTLCLCSAVDYRYYAEVTDLG